MDVARALFQAMARQWPSEDRICFKPDCLRAAECARSSASRGERGYNGIFTADILHYVLTVQHPANTVDAMASQFPQPEAKKMG